MKWVIVTVTMCACICSAGNYAFADHDVTGNPSTNDFEPEVILEGLADNGTELEGGESQQVSAAAGAETFDYRWLLACTENHPEQPMVSCGAAETCPKAAQQRWWLWSLQLTDDRGQPTPAAEWEPVLTECYKTPPPQVVAPRPQVTDELVLREVERLGLPRLVVHVQPAGATLVNFETIFYAEPPDWTRTVQLLGYVVDVESTPSGYTWQFGDGATASTESPGAPYPAKDVTHRYTDAGVSVSPRVDTQYEIRYRVDGGSWQTIDKTVPAAGLPVDLRIREATAVLVGN